MKITITTRRQKQRQENQKRRSRLLAERAGKMSAAHFCYENAKFYWEEDNLPGVVYWENEFRQATAKI